MKSARSTPIKIHTVSVVGVGVAALAIGTAFATVANASRSPISPTSASSSSSRVATLQPTKMGTCIDRADNDTGVGIVSQNFESHLNSYDSRGADTSS